ncbi:MAG TPA: hypothetical protein VJN94_17285 [Candidatus Binataceae bacterium]|nr:hypothetical protein [Candidatus Binataceae bacterium]
MLRLGWVTIAAAVCLLAGCSLGHRDRPSAPQQFLEALERGDGIQADSIWLQMTPADRENLAHGIGLKRKTSAADIRAQLMAHDNALSQDNEAEPGGAENSSTGEAGSPDAETFEMPAAATDPRAGLDGRPNLPSIIQPPAAALIDQQQ